ncbi:MAG: NAD(P)/FAD-dependent oxidoreductase [Lapillicoccus sp.]
MDDLLVVGGGPVGLATALYAARSGLQVSVLERREGQLDKACGEGLMPGALAALADLGVSPTGAPITGITYVSGGRRATASFREGLGRGVRRTVLHDALAEAAAAAGITVVRGVARSVAQDRDRVLVGVAGEDAPLCAHHVVGADGLHSLVRSAVAPTTPSSRPARTSPGHQTAQLRGRSRHGLRRHYALAPWSDTVEVHWGEHAEAYVTPIDDDTVGVAVLTREQASFDALIATFPELGQRLEGAQPTTAVRGAGPFRQRSARRVVGHVLLVGDASGYVDALTGEGLALGLTQARRAVAAIVAGTPAAYERSWRQVSRRPNALTAGLELATRSQLVRRAIVPAASAAPWLFSTIVNELACPATDLVPTPVSR